MALIEKNIVSVRDMLFDKTLSIPNYQRPYTWSSNSATTLFSDIYMACKNKLQEYRIGTIILHKDKDSYNIVDGQQRITTLALLLYLLDKNFKDNISILKEKSYNKISENTILTNVKRLNKHIKTLTFKEKADFKKYLLNNCTFFQIATDELQEAFQFFDSQNSRGKELAPHDLLKSYHLREMTEETEEEKIELISKWEKIPPKELEELFTTYLYPLTHWYKNKNGIDYSVKKIDVFKGIKNRSEYNYLLYHIASNEYIEKANINTSRQEDKLNQFQLTQPIIEGKRFFYYVFHYYSLLRWVRNRIKKFYKKEIGKLQKNNSIETLPESRSGDIYTKNLFEMSVIFFVDKFNKRALRRRDLRILCSWSYLIRLVMSSISLSTINKYALGRHERVTDSFNMFNYIYDMKYPEELKNIEIEKLNIEDKNREKYGDIYDLLQKWNDWE